MFNYARQRLGRFRIVYEQPCAVLVVILFLSSILKLGVWIVVLHHDPAGFLEPDSMDYHNPARALLSIAAFVHSPEQPDVETYRTPGYPLFLAGVYGVFGENHAAVMLLQILLDLGVMLFMYAIARKLWGSSVALIAVLLHALDIISFTYVLKLMPETLFTLLLMAMIWAGIHLIQGQDKKRWAWVLGLCLALMTFTRPISYYLLAPIGGVLLWVSVAQKWNWRQLFSALAGVILPSLVLIGGWQVRNYSLAGLAQYSSVEGVNLLYRQGAAIVAEQDGIDLEEAKLRLWLENTPEGDADSSQRSTVADERRKQQALHLILQHPALFVKTQLFGSIRLLAAPGEGPLLRMLGVPMGKMNSIADYASNVDHPLAGIAALLRYYADYVRRFDNPLARVTAFLALLYLLVVYSTLLIWALRRLREGRIHGVDLFIGTLVFYFVMVSAGHWDSRFRIPILTLVLLYAAPGLQYTSEWMWSKRPQGKLRRLADEKISRWPKRLL